MKNVPEIAPEIRGLLEEIVADPRSAIRLAPRRALSTWFDTGETIRASDVARTKAERHLVEVHREELAALLCEASWISYWKAPMLTHLPVRADGKLFHPTEREPAWRKRAEPEVEEQSVTANGVELLRQCLSGIQPGQGRSLALASLSLVPSDITRCYVALNTQWNTPRAAIALFGRIEPRPRPASLRPTILLHLASQTCHLGLFAEARSFYRQSCFHDPQSPYGWSYAFNLSCFLGDERVAVQSAKELGRLVGAQDPRILNLRSVLREWWKTRTDAEVKRGTVLTQRIQDRLPEAARVLCGRTI